MSGQGASGGNDGTSVQEFLGVAKETDMPEALYAVEPKIFCEHLEKVAPLPSNMNPLNLASPCETCADVGENWLCLVCYKVYCSRYKKGHMVDHNKETGHEMALSFADLSAWCYPCDSYLHNPKLAEVKRVAHLAKFGKEPPAGSI